MPNDTWERMTDREKNAWIAQRVCGWTIAGMRPVQDNVLVTWKNERGFQRHYLRHYTTDPEADYEVLVRVRETWDEPMKRAFGSACVCMIWEPRNLWRDAWLEYQPGDYSHAAYLAMGGE